MNKVFFIGNLTKDVDLRSTQTGKSVATFTIAVQRAFKREGQPEADFFPVVVWGAIGENCAKYLAKGKKIAVIGALQNRSYEDNNGQKRQITEVVASEVEFLTPKSATEGNGLKTGQEPFNEPVETLDEMDDIPF